MTSCIVAVIQQKGGVGKSTIAANLAGELVENHHKVVVLDLDPQQSLTEWAHSGHGQLRDCVRTVELTVNKAQEFRLALDAAQAEAAYILLDCPPGFPEAGMLAALAADVALLPVTPSPLDMRAVKEAVVMMREAQRVRGGKPLIAFVPSKMTRTTLASQLPEFLAGLGELVLPSIGQRVAVAESVLQGLTVREYLGVCDGVVAEFSLLAREVERIARPS